MNKVLSLLSGVMLLISMMYSQDSVDVTFRFNAAPTPIIFLVGEFNGWNQSATPMQFEGNNWWVKTFRLRVGGNPTPPSVGVVGAWQYKFYSAGVGGWQNDPLNHHQNPGDNNNSYLYTNDPTIYQILPNQRQPIIRTAQPMMTAYLFPKVGASIDTSSIIVSIDGYRYTKLGSYYDAVAKQLSFQVPTQLFNGNHIMIVSAGSSGGNINSDTVTFTTQAGFVQITTQGGYVTYNSARMIRGVVMDTSIHSVKLIRNSKDTAIVTVSNGLYSVIDTLAEGLNSFKAIVDTNGVLVSSDSIAFTLRINHTPYAKASVSSFTSNQVTLSAAGSTDPDGRTLTFTWIDDLKTPLVLNGRHGSSVIVTKPTQPGEYYFSLVASDSYGLADTTRSYFTIYEDGSCTSPTIVSNPEWAKRARVYFLFPKAFTSTGTISAAGQRLQYIHDMGFNVIWMMPVMKNAYPIDQHFGPGYNIVDFYNVAPEYGTNDDFKNFISQAHILGLKVILDVTPNHTSRFHPWSLDAHTFREDSRYWTWYEHNEITSNTNGLGDALADGFNFYNGFSDQLLNYNWKDIDARTEMINAYKYWIKYLDLDGYRFDVYWGPHRRYGEAYMGNPVREALKHIKPDILLLGEDDGTGPNTQYIYANAGGGLDASYDFKLYFNQIKNFGFTSTAVDDLDADIINSGYYPGNNSLYMRFMESQDEDCITYFYSNDNLLDAATTFNRTKPMATAIFSVPGFPMIWNGQEVGWGYGISGVKEDRNRSTIGWNFQGGPVLIPHYQRLAWIRGAFPAFATQTVERIESGNGEVYGILRKYQNENAISLCNFGSVSASVSLTLTFAGTPNILLANPQDGKTYYVSDVYNDTTYSITFTGGMTNFSINIPAYGSAILIVSDSVKKISVPIITSVKTNTTGSLPIAFKLYQNYPNPFNPSTTIQFDIPREEKVSIKIFNVLGQEISVLANSVFTAGYHKSIWDGLSQYGRPVSSGVYFVRIEAGPMTDTKKIMLMK